MTDPTAPYGEVVAQPKSTYATWGDRAVATLWDALYSLPPLVLMLVASIPLIVGIGAVDSDNDDVAAIAFLVAGLMFAAGLAWNIWRQINNYVIRQGRTGQTWGKAKVGIWVVDEATGAPPGWASCLGRLFLHSLINQAFYLDYLWPLWDQPKVQTLTDKILATVVVKPSA